MTMTDNTPAPILPESPAPVPPARPALRVVESEPALELTAAIDESPAPAPKPKRKYVRKTAPKPRTNKKAAAGRVSPPAAGPVAATAGPLPFVAERKPSLLRRIFTAPENPKEVVFADLNWWDTRLLFAIVGGVLIAAVVLGVRHVLG